MAEQIGEIYYVVRAETEGLVRGEQMATRSLDRLESEMRETDKAAERMNTSMTGLAKAIAAVVAASALRDMARLVQSYQEMAERVQMATSSQAEYELVQQRLLATANGTYRSLAEAQELFIRTNASLQALGYTTTQALDVMDSLSYSFVTNATSADRAQGAISAVSKAFNTGKVAADQWETITTAIPSVIEQIAAASGKTSAEIRSLGAAGKLTAQQLSEGLRQSLDANSAAAEKMAVNLTDAQVRIRTALQVTLVAVENQTGALQTLTDSLVAAADMMIDFAGDAANVESLMTALTLAVTSTAAVIAGRLVQSLSASAAAFYSNTVAAAAKTRAALSAAQASTAAAAQELILAQAAERAAVGLSSHGAAAQRLVAAQAAATAATNALATAQQRMVGVATVAASAVGALRTALAFLGGPAGVLLLAAGAVFTFATRTEQAKPPTDALVASVGGLGTAAERAAKRFERLTTGIDKLNRKELTLRRGELESQLASAERQLKAFERQFERGVGSVGQVEGARAAVEELRKALEKLGTAKPADEVNLAPVADSGAEKAAKKAQTEAERQAEAIRNQVTELQFQADTLGMTNTELELYKLQLAGATDEQIRAAATSLQLVDAFEAQANAEKAAADAAAEAERKRQAQRQALGQADPIAGEQIRFEDQIASLRALNEAKLLEDQRYLDLKAQAEAAHDEQMRVLQEENFRRQSAGNALLLDTLGEVQTATTNALVGLVTGAANGEEAIRALAGSILNNAVGALVEMGAQYVKNLIMGQAASTAAAATGVATATALSAAYATPAALASLASFGANAAPAAAGISSTVALAQGLSAIPGRRYGGPVAADGMYRVNENGRPEVFQGANGQQFMLPNQRGEVVSNEDATAGGGGGVNVVVNINQSAEKAGTVARTNDGETEMIDVFVADIMGDGRTARAISTKFGLRPAGR